MVFINQLRMEKTLVITLTFLKLYFSGIFSLYHHVKDIICGWAVDTFTCQRCEYMPFFSMKLVDDRIVSRDIQNNLVWTAGKFSLPQEIFLQIIQYQDSKKMLWKLILKNFQNEEGNWLKNFLSAKVTTKNKSSLYHTVQKCVPTIYPLKVPFFHY